jgi:hypothetical protein
MRVITRAPYPRTPRKAAPFATEAAAQVVRAPDAPINPVDSTATTRSDSPSYSIFASAFRVLSLSKDLRDGRLSRAASVTERAALTTD